MQIGFNKQQSSCVQGIVNEISSDPSILDEMTKLARSRFFSLLWLSGWHRVKPLRENLGLIFTALVSFFVSRFAPILSLFGIFFSVRVSIQIVRGIYEIWRCCCYIKTYDFQRVKKWK